MTKYMMAVYSNAVEGRESECNDWYSNVHMADMLKIPGFVAVQRFEAVPAPSGKKAKFKYAAIYEMETDDLQKTMDLVGEAVSRGDMFISDAIDEKAAMQTYVPITDRMTSTVETE